MIAVSCTAVPVVRAEDCSPAHAEKIRKYAQTLDPKADEEGAPFLKKCHQHRDELLLWMTYYYRTRGEYARITALSQSLTPGAGPERGDERDRILEQAALGQNNELEKRVHRGDANYAGDAEALLILARSHARNRRFADARSRYSDYLKAKPDDREIEIEDAYTWLWEGNGRQAQARFTALREMPDLTEAQIVALDTGSLSASKVDVSMSRPRPMDAPAMDFGTEVATTTFYGFTRASTALDYRGELLDGGAQAHWLTSSRPGAGHYGALEGHVGSSTRINDSISIFGRLGGFTTGRSLFLYDLVGEYHMVGGATPYVGSYQNALAKDVPLPENLSNRSRSAVLAGFRYRSFLDVRIESRTFQEITSSTFLSARLAFPLREIQNVGPGGGGLTFVILAENESFRHATDYLYSPESTTALRAAAEYLVDFNEEISGKIAASYGTVFETPSAGSALSFGTSANLLGANTEVGYNISKSLNASFRLRLDRTNGDQGVTTYGATVFGIGLSWKLGKENGK